MKGKNKMSAVDFSVLQLIPKLLEQMQELQNEVTELKQNLAPKYDLTKRAGVKAFLNISDGTLNNMIKDGRFKKSFHYRKEIKGKTIKITFVEDGILAYKKEKGLK